jgi:signal transduction histidine kinase
MEFSTLVRFSRLVADSPNSESVSTLLAQTVVDRCRAHHALVFGTGDSGEFRVLASYGGCESAMARLSLNGVDTAADLRGAVMAACERKDYTFRALPLISNAGLFGVLGVLCLESVPPSDQTWTFIEGLTELTAISLNKNYQHQKLQQAFDDLRVSQETLIRTEKFRALGEMSAGIAHDLKNLLNPLQLYIDHLRDSVDNREEILDTAERLDRVVARGLETVERLRGFSRLAPEDSEAIETDLNAMAREAIEISKAKLVNSKVVVEWGSPSPVLLRAADCVTAIVNLIFNAVDAVQGKGTITIRTGVLNNEARESWIEVEDDGPGIPPDIRDKIMEPLFTTKGNQGTGLGIPIVFAFTQKHGGRLDIESAPGKGARFRMWFPAAAAK